MIDRIFSAVLTFGLLTAGTLAIGSEWFGTNHRGVRVVHLQPVVVVAKKLASAEAIAESDCREAAATLEE